MTSEQILLMLFMEQSGGFRILSSFGLILFDSALSLDSLDWHIDSLRYLYEGVKFDQ